MEAHCGTGRRIRECVRSLGGVPVVGLVRRQPLRPLDVERAVHGLARVAKVGVGESARVTEVSILYSSKLVVPRVCGSRSGSSRRAGGTSREPIGSIPRRPAPVPPTGDERAATTGIRWPEASKAALGRAATIPASQGPRVSVTRFPSRRGTQLTPRLRCFRLDQQLSELVPRSTSMVRRPPRPAAGLAPASTRTTAAMVLPRLHQRRLPGTQGAQSASTITDLDRERKVSDA